MTATEEGCPFTCPYYGGPEPQYSEDMCPKSLDYLGRSVHISIPPQMPLSDCDLIIRGVEKVSRALMG